MESTVVSTIGEARLAITGGTDIVVLPMREKKLEVYIRSSQTALIDLFAQLYCAEQFRSNISGTVCFVYAGSISNLKHDLARAANC